MCKNLAEYEEDNLKKCKHFTEFGEELIFIDKENAEIKCLNCGEIFIYRR